ncbi:hypothetical protein BJ322DRAFT_1114611 [Thelephora terrestris]|uniref:Uncharacterized protein n=1 Tax=Thelephora terrestris TaxID=56493 RepID=A0A9P6H5N3_9AGAM|nr:hypothetical protein BJ322DRAFT_1114611 [Thelephora terrestris]
MTTPSGSDQVQVELSPQEKEDIKEKARWLRRVANPFVDFYIIVVIGAAGSPAATEAARGREDRHI